MEQTHGLHLNGPSSTSHTCPSNIRRGSLDLALTLLLYGGGRRNSAIQMLPHFCNTWNKAPKSPPCGRNVCPFFPHQIIFECLEEGPEIFLSLNDGLSNRFWPFWFWQDLNWNMYFFVGVASWLHFQGWLKTSISPLSVGHNDNGMLCFYHHTTWHNILCKEHFLSTHIQFINNEYCRAHPKYTYNTNTDWSIE